MTCLLSVGAKALSERMATRDYWHLCSLVQLHRKYTRNAKRINDNILKEYFYTPYRGNGLMFYIDTVTAKSDNGIHYPGKQIVIMVG